MAVVKNLRLCGGGSGGGYFKKGRGEGTEKGMNGGDEFTSFVYRPGNLV